MTAKRDARLVMETVAELHHRGYGRLKLFCYVKEGLGAWRHWLFASDSFPESAASIFGPVVKGSIPWLSTPTVQGTSPMHAADGFVLAHTSLVEAAKGRDQLYVEWYAGMLRGSSDGILEMESSRVATIGGCSIRSPYA